MAINLGTLNADSFYVGDEEVTGLFAGSTRAWPSIFSGSFQALPGYRSRAVSITTSSINTHSFYIGATSEYNGAVFTNNYASSNGVSATISSVIRVERNDTLDIFFNNNIKTHPYAITPTAWSVACDTAGRLYVGSEGQGVGRVGAGSIQRFTSGGVYDPTFQFPTFSMYAGPRDVEILSNGDVLLAVWEGFNYDSGSVNRLNTNGAFVPTFNCTVTQSFFDLEVDESVNTVWAGTVSKEGATSASLFAFNLTTGVTSYQKRVSAPVSSSILAIKKDNQGQNLYVGGYFNNYDGSTYNNIVKISYNGIVDSTFNIGSGFNNTVRDIHLQADGKVIAVGDFTTYSGSVVNRIVRLNTNGTRDTSFITGTGINGLVEDVDIFNNLIYAVGDFTTYNGTAANRIVRLDKNGLKS